MKLILPLSLAVAATLFFFGTPTAAAQDDTGEQGITRQSTGVLPVLSLRERVRLDGAPFHRYSPDIFARSGFNAGTRADRARGFGSPTRFLPQHIQLVERQRRR